MTRLSSTLRLAISSLDGDELLVGRFELFLGGLELLVDALQLLVGRLHFLVRGLKFLVGRLVGFLYHLQVVARFDEIGFELGDAAGLLLRGQPLRLGRWRFAVWIRRPALGLASVFEEDQKTRLAQVLQRNHLQVHAARLAARPDANAVPARRLHLLLRFVDRGAQRQHEAFAGHLQHVEAGLAAGRLEPGAGRPAELQHLQRGADEHARRRELVDRHAIGLALCVQLAGQPGRRRLCLCVEERQRRQPARLAVRLAARLVACQMQRRRRRVLLPIDLLLLVERLEQIGEAADRFGSTQQQEAFGLERENGRWGSPSSADSVRGRSEGYGN